MASVNAAAVRAADTLIRSVGGTQVLLRTPAPANPDDDGEQLGLSTPQFQDSPLSPVVYRRVRPKFSAVTNSHTQYELLVSATAVNALIGSGAYDSADTLFATAFAVIIDSVPLEIVSATASEIGGAPYIYRLLLQAPLALKT